MVARAAWLPAAKPCVDVVLVNWLLNIPIEIRLGLLFLCGLWLGRQINRGIYSLAWNSRALGPWAPPPANAPPRRAVDRWLVIGWCGLRRERVWHGRGYWIRPLLLELATGVAVALLYWFETEQFLLWPHYPHGPVPEPLVVHLQFVSHVLLFALMMVATFIDFDEQTIPDSVTVTGTVLGLLLAVSVPPSLLPTVFEPANAPPELNHLVLTSSAISFRWLDGLGGPFSWPRSLNQWPGLCLGLGIVWGWCFALMHKTWTLRRGVGKALQYLVTSVVRRGTWILPAVLGGSLSVVIICTWWLDGGAAGSLHWQALLSAVVGLGFGTGLIWAVRVIAGHALQVEAMGFGDVTLMGMIGAFLGWQAAFLVFFLAPFAALLIALVQRLLTGNPRIAFGPYLCFSALIVVLGWNVIWNDWAHSMFVFGWLILAMLACCLVLMGILLWFWRMVRDACL